MVSEKVFLPRALLLDMDGTITAPVLDFSRIKAEMGIGNQPILEALAQMPPRQRAKAQAILHRHEEQAAANSTLNPGCKELFDFLAWRRIASAVITRNSLPSVRTVVKRHKLVIAVLITREDGRFKPDPHPLLLACRRLKVPPDHAWMVGDGPQDIEAGLAANIKTVWVSHGRRRPFAAVPWQTVRDLNELLSLLGRCVS